MTGRAKAEAERNRVIAATVRAMARQGFGVEDITIKTGAPYSYIALALRTTEDALRPYGDLAFRRAAAERRRTR